MPENFPRLQLQPESMSHTPWAFDHDHILLIYDLLAVLYWAATQLTKARRCTYWSDFAGCFCVLSAHYASERVAYIRLCLSSILGGDGQSDHGGQEFAYKKTNRRSNFVIEDKQRTLYPGGKTKPFFGARECEIEAAWKVSTVIADQVIANFSRGLRPKA